MCGIVGFLDKREQADFPLGRTLLTMLQALSCRGPDSAGVALFGPPSSSPQMGRGRGGAMQLRLSVPPGTKPETLSGVFQEERLTIQRSYPSGVHDVRIAAEVDPVKLEKRLQHRLPGSEILCLGEHMSLFKQVGSPDELEASYHISALHGTYGIGHTRMSTESRVDLSHSQPFWAHGVPDLATVHNGHITNYHKLRRRYEQEGYRFYTDNDSEVIGVYLRDRLAAGRSLEGAMRSSLEDFDGSFCYLAATKEQLGFVKDRFGFKPLVLAETEDFVALATEEIALRRALGHDFVSYEPAPGTMQLWSVHADVASGAG